MAYTTHNRKHAFALMSPKRFSTTPRCFSFQATLTCTHMLLIRKDDSVDEIQILVTKVDGLHNRKHAFALMSPKRFSTTPRCFSFQATLTCTHMLLIREDDSVDENSNSCDESRWPTQQKTCICLNVS